MRFRPWGAGLALAGVLTASLAQVPAGNPLDLLPATPTPTPRQEAPPRVDASVPQGATAVGLERRITPIRFDISGVKVLPFAEVAQPFAALVGQPVTVAQLVAAAGAATARYRDAHYPLSFVFVPEQDFAGGAVRVVAVEGHVDAIRIEGDAGSAEPTLRAISAALLEEKPLTQATFERVTQLYARVPGVTVSASASLPQDMDGHTTLVLKAKHQPYNVTLGADLRQPVPRAVLSGIWNDPLAAGGQLNASTLLGDPAKERLWTLGYNQLIGADGLRLKANYSDYRGYPDESLGKGDVLERLNTNHRLDLSADYPLLLTAQRSVTVSGGFYAVDNVDRYSVPAAGQWLAQETQVRAAFVQLNLAETQASSSRSASLMLAQGFDGLGARDEFTSNVPGLAGAGSTQSSFTRVAADYTQRNRFANQWGTAFSLGGQYSAQSLAPSERISFGGTRFGRAYAAGDAAGDAGWGAGIELNRVLRFDSTWVKQVEPYLLVETAQVHLKNGRPVPRDLGSVALGLRLTDARYYSVDLAVAKPTGDAALNNPQRDPRFSLLLSYQLDAL